MASGVYAIVQISTGDLYVGSSSRLWERAERHFHLLEDDKHFNRKLQEAYWQTPDGFAFVVLEWVWPDRLTEREQVWLDRMRKRKRGKVFNIQMDVTRPDDDIQAIPELNYG